MKVLVFDYDGTIIDSLDSVMHIFNKVAPGLGIKPVKDKGEFTKFYDLNFYDSMRNLGCSEETIGALVREINKEVKNFSAKTKVFDACDEVLTKLGEDNIVIIVTSNTTAVIEKSIEVNNIFNVQEVIGADKELSKVRRIASIKEKYPGKDVIYIGDTVGDIIEARQAGVKVVAVTWGYHDKEKLKEAHPDFLVDSPDELVGLFDKK